MGSVSARVDALKVNRGLGQAVHRRAAKKDAGTRLWERKIEQATHDAKKTRCGVPTDSALLARWWIAEYRPPKSDREEWKESFEGTCMVLEMDAEAWRKRLIAQIDQCWKAAAERHLQSVIYIRRAMVLACAGIPTAISRQYLMPLVDEKEYEQVAGIDHGDQFVMYDRRETEAA